MLELPVEANKRWEIIYNATEHVTLLVSIYVVFWGVAI